MDKEKKPNGCLVGCLTLIFIAIGLFVVLMIWTNVTGYKSSPEDKAESELSMLDNHYNEIMTDMANLNVTGHGDFINMMNDQISFAQASIQDLDEDYGDESEIINLCKQAWTDLSGIARSAKDGIANNDMAMVDSAKQSQNDYLNTIQQIKNLRKE